jgi:DNA-directed RNA polymerase specialized sigma24 family protein
MIEPRTLTMTTRHPATTLVARENRPQRLSLQRANAARLGKGRRLAVAMLTLKLGGVPQRGIAETFDTSYGAVRARLSRLRRGRYDH